MDGRLDLAELEALYSSLSPQERDELLQCLLIAARVGLPTPPPEILPGWFPRLLPQEQGLRRASLWDVGDGQGGHDRNPLQNCFSLAESGSRRRGAEALHKNGGS